MAYEPWKYMDIWKGQPLSVHDLATLLRWGRIYFSSDAEANLFIRWGSQKVHAYGPQWLHENRLELGNEWHHMAMDFREEGRRKDLERKRKEAKKRQRSALRKALFG